MDTHSFDTIAKRLAERRLSRRQALLKGSTGLAAGALAATGFAAASAAQNATPASAAAPAESAGADEAAPHMLYVQTYQKGSIAPKAGAAGTWTVTLENGAGQTIYFADRPDRFAGALDTPAFLDGLGFPPDNPPNAALIFKNEQGTEDITTVELFNPSFDTSTNTATYDVKWLKEYQELNFTLQEAPEPPANASASFGAAHLFIDGIFDCPDYDLTCFTGPGPRTGQAHGTIPNADHDGFCVDRPQTNCYPCKRPDAGGTWADECNRRFSACNGACSYWPGCTNPFVSGRVC